MVKRALFGRMALWLAGVALPATPLLQDRLREATRALMFGLAGSFVLSSLFLATLYGGFAYLTRHGVSAGVAFLLVGGTAFLSGGILILLSMREIRRAASIKSDLGLFAEHPFDSLKRAATRLPVSFPVRETGNSVKDIANAFVDGLLNGRPASAGTDSAASEVRPFVHAEFDAGLHRQAEERGHPKSGRSFL